MARAELAPPTARRAWQRGEQRRSQLAEAAAQQFYRRGFRQVSVADVAADVGLTAPAIYRHFASKEDLLFAAVRGGLDTVEETLARAGAAAPDAFLDAAAGAAITRRDLWILLQREIRHLSPEQRRPLEDQLSRIARPFADLARRERVGQPASDTGLITTAILGALGSASVYHARMPETEQQAVLAAAARAVLACSWDAGAGQGNETDPGWETSEARLAGDRGAQALDTAIRLFASRGFQFVSLDDIGAEMGMAGPSLYYYYATKSDILVAAFARATEWLAAQRHRAGQPPSLEDMVAAYVELGVRQRLLLTVYVWEALNLPPEAGRRIRSALDADIAAWRDALAVLRPELTARQQLVLVHAARAVVHDVVRLGHWHDRADITIALRALVRAVLTAPITRRQEL